MAKKKEKKKEWYKHPLKIVSKFWFWIAVAIVSYLIMISIPIQWGDNGEPPVDNGIFFAYLTQFAWIIAVSIFIIDIIKWIHKTKIGETWKISLTILGIVGIIAYIYFSLSGMGIFDTLTYENDARIGDLDNEELIKIHIDMIEERGYEVIYFGYLLEDTEVETAYIKMKSLGNAKEQVYEGLFSLVAVYPDAPEYSILILEPTQQCWYVIDGKVWRGYEGTENYTIDEKEVSSGEFFQVMEYQIENPTCS